MNPGTTYTAEVCLFTQGGGVGECSATVDYTVPTENTAPVAEITAPADGSEFSDTDIITFAGTGTDAEDGSLTGASLVWTSDVDGELGTGETFDLDAALATPGAHVITLTATDSQNAIGQASILIEIVGTPATISFADDILPYFAGSCNACHGAAALGGIRLDSYTEVSTGSNANGPLIVAGNSADATAILLPQVEADHNNGPDDAAFAVDLAQWIDDGAADN